MSSLSLLARLLLVIVFGSAGAAKLADLRASSDTIEAFGLPRRLARPAGAALPIAELAIAVALLPSPSARWAAVGALLLLLTFSAGVAYALSQGRTPACNCFGQVSSDQIGPRTLIRNGAFILIAAFAVWRAPGAALTDWTRSAAAANLLAALLALAVALLSVLALHYRRLARASPQSDPSAGAQVPGLPIGTEAPDFTLPDLDGRLVSRDSLLEDGRPLLLVFASPTCGPCHALMPEIGRWQAALGDSIKFVVIESGAGNAEVLRRTLTAAGEATILHEEDRETAERYGASATPIGLAVSSAGKIASQPMPGQSRIESLVRAMLSASEAQTGRHETSAHPA